jgi:hypothetical protein
MMVYYILFIQEVKDMIINSKESPRLRDLLTDAQDFFSEFGSILLVPTGPVLVLSILHVFRFSRSLSLGLSLKFIIISFTS